MDAQGNYATATGDHACVTNSGTSAYASLDQSALRSDVDSLSAFLQTSGSQTTAGSTRKTGSGIQAAVYDVLGRRVQTLAADRRLAAGTETLEFSADGVPNGVYLIRVRVDATSGGTHTFTEKVTVVR